MSTQRDREWSIEEDRWTYPPVHFLRVRRVRSSYAWRLFNGSAVVGHSTRPSQRPSDAIAEARNEFDWLRILVVEEPPYGRSPGRVAAAGLGKP